MLLLFFVFLFFCFSELFLLRLLVSLSIRLSTLSLFAIFVTNQTKWNRNEIQILTLVYTMCNTHTCIYLYTQHRNQWKFRIENANRDFDLVVNSTDPNELCVILYVCSSFWLFVWSFRFRNFLPFVWLINRLKMYVAQSFTRFRNKIWAIAYWHSGKTFTTSKSVCSIVSIAFHTRKPLNKFAFVRICNGVSIYRATPSKASYCSAPQLLEDTVLRLVSFDRLINLIILTTC